MDIVTPEQRSKNMTAIKSKNTKPEVYFRKLLFAKGYRYSLNSKAVPGHPDIYLKKYNTVIFVHGCFWHRHEGCKFAYTPKSRIEFWKNKFELNCKRDLTVRSQLLEQKVKCIVIWECAIKEMKKNNFTSEAYLEQIEKFFGTEELYMEI